jgi:hypothetical protein
MTPGKSAKTTVFARPVTYLMRDYPTITDAFENLTRKTLRWPDVEREDAMNKRVLEVFIERCRNVTR